MRQSIILLVVILLAVTLYTAYGLMTFKPDEATPFVFAEPVLPPELNKNAPESAQMSAAQQEQKDAAMAQVTQAMTLYEGYEAAAPAQAISAFNLLHFKTQDVIRDNANDMSSCFHSGIRHQSHQAGATAAINNLYPGFGKRLPQRAGRCIKFRV